MYKLVYKYQNDIEEVLDAVVEKAQSCEENYVLIAPYASHAAFRSMESAIKKPGIITVYKTQEAFDAKYLLFPFTR